MEHFENFEQPKQPVEAVDEAIHGSLRPLDKTESIDNAPEGESPEREGGLDNRVKARQSKEQGDIGEGVVIRAASEKLGLTPDPSFDASYHGIDCLYRGKGGELVVVEAKFTEERLHKALDNNKQMQPEWVEKKAQQMQNPQSAQFTPGNRELGAQIERIGPENIRRIVITIHPTTMEMEAYAGNDNGGWDQIGKWSALEFPEQPHSY
ncbi:MAG: hypothetical protein H0T73_03830 [Ardenticatenales bacterium]|nr:hypothetical protein [Ardenticatenales bacterium]